MTTPTIFPRSAVLDVAAYRRNTAYIGARRPKVAKIETALPPTIGSFSDEP